MARTEDSAKLFLFDFDGTALGGHTPYAQFPPFFAAFLDDLASKGISWGINSGWSVQGQRNVVTASDVESSPSLLIGDGGRQVATLERGRTIMDSEYSESIAKLDGEFRRKNRSLFMQTARTILDLDYQGSFQIDFSHKNTLSFSCGEKDESAARKLVDPLLESGQFILLQSGDAEKEFFLMPEYWNKARPVLHIQSKWDIAPEQIIFAGDELNDLSMMDPRVAGHLVCPANSHEEIKRKVREHGGTVSDREFSWGVVDGVTRLLAGIHAEEG